MRRLTVVALFLSMVSACRCGNNINQVELGFQVDTRSLEFGRVLEGGRKTLPVTLSPTSVGSITVQASAPAPFALDASVEVPGGGTFELPVTFLAANVEASGTLTLSAGTTAITVALHGVGVRPPPCIPSGPCVMSVYDLDLDACVESPSPDDSPCDPGNICLEQGRCKASQCLGVARTCDDANACTVDGCSMTTGCVHVERMCPAPTALCKVAACDPVSGCGQANAPDDTLCGPADCVMASVCRNGNCITISTPDNTPCGDGLACEPAGTCQSHTCVRPDAGDWVPTWSARLPGAFQASGPMVTSDVALYLPLCGVAVSVDAGPDGGDDGGLDAGTTCVLTSYTTSGFERFTAPFDDGLPREVWHVGPRGVLVRADGGFEYRSNTSGVVLETLAMGVPREGVVLAPDGAVDLLVAGGLFSWTTDAGALPRGTINQASVLVSDPAGVLYAYDVAGGRLAQVTLLDDGGLSVISAAGAFGVPSLTVSGRGDAFQAVAGGATVVNQSDGGALSTTLLAVAPGPMPRGALQSTTQAVRFGQACPVPLITCPVEQQTLWVTVDDLFGGATAWQLAAPLPATLIEPVMFDTPGPASFPGEVTVGALVSLDGGQRSALVVVARGVPDGGVPSPGELVLLCPLRPASTDVRAAAFVGTQMIAVVARGDAGFALESFPLQALTVHARDWSVPEGAGGSRRAR
jgi:hypothetical protein